MTPDRSLDLDRGVFRLVTPERLDDPIFDLFSLPPRLARRHRRRKLRRRLGLVRR